MSELKNSELKNQHGQTMTELKQRLDGLADLIPPDRPILYMDYPFHRNIGDLLIMLGTLAFFEQYNLRPERCLSVVNIPAEFTAPKDAVILCHGGGNFGDLHPKPQQVREYLVQRHPHNRIIILPQTIHFANQARLEEVAKLFQTHEDIHFVLRDRVSYDLASKYFSHNHLYLFPDMAHYLWPLAGGGEQKTTRGRTLVQLRRDAEASQQSEELRNETTTSFDWDDLFSAPDRVLYKALRTAARLDKGVGNSLPLWGVWQSVARGWAERAVSLFRQHDTIVTSRLHGHILACLLSIPHELIDNSYGKNSRYFETWTKPSGLATLRKGAV